MTLTLRLQAIGFAIEIDSIDGSIIELDADVAWQPWQNFGFGAGFKYFKCVRSGPCHPDD